jgi:hypothetical protein
LNKIVLKKTTSAIFLAIVLVVGTIALSFPLFIVGTAQATSDRDNDYDNDDKNHMEKIKMMNQETMIMTTIMMTRIIWKR